MRKENQNMSTDIYPISPSLDLVTSIDKISTSTSFSIMVAKGYPKNVNTSLTFIYDYIRNSYFGQYLLSRVCGIDFISGEDIDVLLFIDTKSRDYIVNVNAIIDPNILEIPQYILNKSSSHYITSSRTFMSNVSDVNIHISIREKRFLCEPIVELDIVASEISSNRDVKSLDDLYDIELYSHFIESIIPHYVRMFYGMINTKNIHYNKLLDIRIGNMESTNAIHFKIFIKPKAIIADSNKLFYTNFNLLENTIEVSDDFIELKNHNLQISDVISSLYSSDSVQCICGYDVNNHKMVSIDKNVNGISYKLNQIHITDRRLSIDSANEGNKIYVVGSIVYNNTKIYIPDKILDISYVNGINIKSIKFALMLDIHDLKYTVNESDNIYDILYRNNCKQPMNTNDIIRIDNLVGGKDLKIIKVFVGSNFNRYIVYIEDTNQEVHREVEDNTKTSLISKLFKNKKGK